MLDCDWSSDVCSSDLPLAFDHAQILADYFRFRKTGRRPL
jgi:hypothetical protein